MYNINIKYMEYFYYCIIFNCMYTYSYVNADFSFYFVYFKVELV